MFKRVLISLRYSLVLVFFPILSGVIITIGNITDKMTIYSVQGACFIVAAILGGLLYKRKYPDKRKGLVPYPYKKFLWFLPLIVMEGIVFFQGISKGDNGLIYLVLFAFTLAVGFAEEFFFRGIILTILQEDGKLYGIVVSSILFGVLHAANILGGANLFYTFLQVLFAFLFGFAAGLIVTMGGSLIPVILWHFAHNFISLLTGDGATGTIDSLSFTISGIQTAILILYGIYLLVKLKEN
ncbi:MAG: CPBP family intramembrane metalloprotease [Gallicola sp.]|nr:CPBP family intramembrane metalloprotease [Gallicola sp.]